MGKGGKEEKWNLGCVLRGRESLSLRFVAKKNYTHGNRQREREWE